MIIHDSPEGIDLPDRQDDPAFNDVYIVKGDPTSEVVLRRAKVPRAHSVVILSDDREGKHADGKTILTCIAIKNICKGDKQPQRRRRVPQPVNNRHHLKKAGADEIISSDELGLRLLARTALYHGMTRVYQELLTVGRDANEMYLLPVPDSLVGPRLRRDRQHVRPPPRRQAVLPPDRDPARRGDDAQPDQLRGRPDRGRRPAHPPQPGLPHHHPPPPHRARPRARPAPALTRKPHPSSRISVSFAVEGLYPC